MIATVRAIRCGEYRFGGKELTIQLARTTRRDEVDNAVRRQKRVTKKTGRRKFGLVFTVGLGWSSQGRDSNACDALRMLVGIRMKRVKPDWRERG